MQVDLDGSRGSFGYSEDLAIPGPGPVDVGVIVQFGEQSLVSLREVLSDHDFWHGVFQFLSVCDDGVSEVSTEESDDD